MTTCAPIVTIERHPMQLSIPDLKRRFEAVQAGKKARHLPQYRIDPSIFQ